MFIYSVSINRWSAAGKPSGSMTLKDGTMQVQFDLPAELVAVIEQLASDAYAQSLRAALVDAVAKVPLTFSQEQAAKALTAPPIADAEIEPIPGPFETKDDAEVSL